jgi:hypothetical protein
LRLILLIPRPVTLSCFLEQKRNRLERLGRGKGQGRGESGGGDEKEIKKREQKQRWKRCRGETE